MEKILSDEKIIEAIKAGGMKRQHAIKGVYGQKKLKNQIVAFVKKNSGNHEEGVEVFHEGIIALDANVRNGKYRGESSIQGYLFSICRYIWLNKIRKNKRVELTDDMTRLDQVNVETPEAISLEDEQKSVINTMLSQIGEKCKQILELWRLSYSMEEIAEQVGLSNAGIARRQRYNCYQKLIKLVEQTSTLKNYLKPS